MTDKATNLQIIGSLMRRPQFLAELDKYIFTPDNFEYKLDKYIFVAIDSLFHQGAKEIKPIDIENYLNANAQAKLIFEKQNGIEYLQDAYELAQTNNFQYYYNKFKKFNLLTAYKNLGIDISQYYIDDPTDLRSLEINGKFEDLEIEDIISDIKKKLLGVEREFKQNDTTEVCSVLDGLDELVAGCNTHSDIGLPLQGDIFNEVCSGARKGTFVLRSAASGTGKTRQAVGDACYLAFPIRYSQEEGKWIMTGSNEKVLYIMTEQTPKEIQLMILAYLTGFNETRFRYGGFTDEEKKIINGAIQILATFESNLFLIKMPSPTVEGLKAIVRETVILHNIEYVFFDYIFICPSLLGEFRGFNLRNDELLLIMSTALKDLAVELNVFMMSSTQVNSNADDNKDIRNESSIAGSRAIINKADIGCIAARPTKEELDILQRDNAIVIMPNMVTDIYKVRSGQWTQVRIWSNIDLGTLRKQDLFVTDSRMCVIDFCSQFNFIYTPVGEELIQLNNILSSLNEV